MLNIFAFQGATKFVMLKLVNEFKSFIIVIAVSRTCLPECTAPALPSFRLQCRPPAEPSRRSRRVAFVPRQPSLCTHRPRGRPSPHSRVARRRAPLLTNAPRESPRLAYVLGAPLHVVHREGKDAVVRRPTSWFLSTPPPGWTVAGGTADGALCGGHGLVRSGLKGRRMHEGFGLGLVAAVPDRRLSTAQWEPIASETYRPSALSSGPPFDLQTLRDLQVNPPDLG